MTKPRLIEFTGTTKGMLPFNLSHVRSFGWAEGKRSYSFESGHTRVNLFPISNFFRKLFGRPLLKPRRTGYWNAPCVGVFFTNSYKEYEFKSNKKAEEAFEHLLKEFELVRGNKR